MSVPNYKRTKFACYAAYFTMSSVFCLPALLFTTLQEVFGISYTLLGTLIAVNFCTQLAMDLLFTFFSKKFNVKIIVKIMPLLTALGLVVYAVVPTLFPNVAYLGLLIGTIIFSMAAGFSEVLLSPTIAAIPSDNPQRDMSKLHSLYAFGVFTVAVITTVFIKVFGAENWMWLTLFFAVLPVFAAVLFMTSPLPDINGEEVVEKKVSTKDRAIGIGLCAACIFFGSCAENVMSNWVSTYAQNGLGLDKALGDLLGMALFAILLGLVRILYSKYGKNIGSVLLVGMCGAVCCYLVAGLVPYAVPAFIACALTGVFTAMLWPGTLIFMEENISAPGVAAYALMASAGDCGAALAPQLMGVVADGIGKSSLAAKLSGKLHLSADQIGLKAGMLVSSLFSILGIVAVLLAIRFFKKQSLKKDLPLTNTAK